MSSKRRHAILVHASTTLVLAFFWMRTSATAVPAHAASLEPLAPAAPQQPPDDEEEDEEGGEEATEEESQEEKSDEAKDGDTAEEGDQDADAKASEEKDKPQNAQARQKGKKPPVDDGLTDEERDLLRRPMTELTPEQQQRRREVVRKMQEHLRKNLKPPPGAVKPEPPGPTPENTPGAEGAQGTDAAPPPAPGAGKPPRTRGPRRQRDQAVSQDPLPEPPQDQPVTEEPPVSHEPEQPQQDEAVPAAPKRNGAPRQQPGGAARSQPPAAAAGDKQEPTLVELPDLPADADNLALPWNQRHYSFTIQRGSYRDLVDTFAMQAGLPLLNAAEQLTDEAQGQVAYSSLENMDFYTALSEVNDLLYHQIRPPLYLFLRYDPETGSPRLELYAIREWRNQLPDSRVFMSLDRVKLAGLRGSDIVRVYFTPKNAAQMRVYSEQAAAVLDDIALTNLTGNGYIDYYGRLDQLYKMLDSMETFENMFQWSTNLERIHLKHITPAEAIVMLKGLVEGVVEQAEAAPSGGGRRNRQQEAAGAELIESAKIVVIPDDAHKSLLVQGLAYKVDEVKEVLQSIDIPPAAPDVLGATMRVIKLKHAGADEAAELLDAVVNGSKVAVRHDRKGGKPNVEVDTDVALDITPDSRSQVLILAGSTEVLNFAEQFLRENIDVPADKRSSFRRVAVQHVDPQVLADLLTEIISSSGGRRKPKEGAPGGEFRAQVAAKSLILVGEPADMENAEILVRELDVPEIDKATLFWAELERAEPSKVVTLLESQQAQEGAAPATGPKEGVRRPGRPGAPQRFIPDDASSILYFTGTQTEWEQDILPVIKKIDQIAKVSSRSGQVIPVEYTTPEEIIAVLDPMFGHAGPRAKPEEAGLQFFPAPRGLMVVGDPTKGDMDTIRQVVTVLDVDPATIYAQEVQKFYPIKHADPAQVIAAIQTMLSGEGGPVAPEAPAAGPKKARRLRGAQPASSSGVRVVPAGDGIIVFTVEANLPKIEQIIAMMDRPDAGANVVFKSFKIMHVDPYQIEEQLYPLLESMLAREFQDAAGQNPPRELLNVVADGRTGRILVSAPQAVVDYAATMLTELDVAHDGGEKSEAIYQCINAKASELAQILGAMYAGGEPPQPVLPPQAAPDKDRPGSRVRVSPSLMRRAAASGSSGVEIMPLPGDKALSIVAPTRAEVDEILARASEIDASSLSDEKITRSFALRWCDPEQIARDMIDMLDQRAPARAGEETDAWSWETGPEIGKDITALPSVTTRTVIVVAPPAKMTAAAHLIQMFEDLADPGNVAAEAEQPVEFYTPTYLSAAECLDATNKYLDAVYGAFSERPVTLSVFNRTLVLKGKRRHFDMIKQILTEEIDTAKTAEALDATRAITFVKVPSNVQQEVLFKLLESSLDLDIDIEGIQGEEAVPDEVLVPEVKVIRPEKAAAGTPER